MDLPKCGYSHLKNFFPLEVDEEFKAKHADTLKLAFFERLRQTTGLNIDKLGFTLDQEDIYTAVKFSQVEMVLDDLKFNNSMKADFHLRFAWSERMRLCQPISEPILSNAIGIIIDRLKLYEHEKQLKRITSNPKQTLAFLASLEEEREDKVINFLCLIYEAQQWDRLGQSSRARELLKEAMKKSPSEKSKKVPMFKLKVLENEIKHLKEALIAYKEAIKANEEDLDLQHPPFLIGELHRRIGLFPESKAWLELALAQTKAEGKTKNFNRWIFETFEVFHNPCKARLATVKKSLLLKLK